MTWWQAHKGNSAQLRLREVITPSLAEAASMSPLSHVTNHSAKPTERVVAKVTKDT
jgi:hypothetical protein